jgi:hypothetical protein
VPNNQQTKQYKIGKKKKKGEVEAKEERDTRGENDRREGGEAPYKG